VENMGGVCHLIDRQPLPQPLKDLIATIEASGMKIDAPPKEGADAIRPVMQLVDGHNLLAGVMACLLGAKIQNDNSAAILNGLSGEGTDPDETELEPDPAADDTDPPADPPAEDDDAGRGSGDDADDGKGNELETYEPDDNDTVEVEGTTHDLIHKGGGHYLVVTREGKITEKIRGKDAAIAKHKEITGAD